MCFKLKMEVCHYPSHEAQISRERIEFKHSERIPSGPTCANKIWTFKPNMRSIPISTNENDVLHGMRAHKWVHDLAITPFGCMQFTFEVKNDLFYLIKVYFSKK